MASEYIGFGEMMRRRRHEVILTMMDDEPSDDELPEENLSTDFTHEPNEVVPAKAGWMGGIIRVSYQKRANYRSFTLLLQRNLEKDLVVSTDACQEK
jgi:hypothetical protein